MSADIDINDRLWVTIRADGNLELNIDCDGDIVSVNFDSRDAEQRGQLESLKSVIQHCLNISSTLYEGDL